MSSFIWSMFIQYEFDRVKIEKIETKSQKSMKHYQFSNIKTSVPLSIV